MSDYYDDLDDELDDYEDELEENNEQEGCYIATSVYGSYDCPSVWVLRHFRDEFLKRYFLGRAFIRSYYFISPKLVKAFGKTNWFNRIFKIILDPMVSNLKRKGYKSEA